MEAAADRCNAPVKNSNQTKPDNEMCIHVLEPRVKNTTLAVLGLLCLALAQLKTFAGREQTIELLDLQGHVLAPACTVTGFELGKWLRFRFSGTLQIRLTNQNSSTTALLSALMFDQAP